MERIIIKIEDISFEGQGIGKSEGLAFFVEDTLPGDLVEIVPTKMKKNYGFGERLFLIEPSKDRIEAQCPHEKECGGCSFQSYGYDAQLKLKEKQIREKLIRIAGIENPMIKPILGMEDPFRYRNKAVLQVDANLGSVGYFEKKSHHVVDVPYCMLQAEPANAVAQVIRGYIRNNHTTLIQVVVKTAFHTGEVMVVIIAEKTSLPKQGFLIEQLNEAIEDLEPSKNGVRYSLENVTVKERDKDKDLLLAGKPAILEDMMGLEFEISSNSFYQVNTLQAEKLFKKALEYADLKGGENILDLYCGVGTIGLLAAKDAHKVLGIEAVKGSVINANRNATLNGLVNITFKWGKAEDELPKGLDWEPDLVFIDPPRTGCAPELLEALAEASPNKIIYVSCDPATLARDLKFLIQKGYEFIEATPVDMFPWTNHIETVVLIQRKN